MQFRVDGTYSVPGAEGPFEVRAESPEEARQLAEGAGIRVSGVSPVPEPTEHSTDPRPTSLGNECSQPGTARRVAREFRRRLSSSVGKAYLGCLVVAGLIGLFFYSVRSAEISPYLDGGVVVEARVTSAGLKRIQYTLETTHRHRRSGAEYKTSDDVDEMTPFVDYAYYVGGSEYTGMFVPTDPSNPYDGEVRKKLLRQYKTDDMVVIRYLKSEPTSSKPEYEVQAYINKLDQRRHLICVLLAFAASPIVLVFLGSARTIWLGRPSALAGSGRDIGSPKL